MKCVRLCTKDTYFDEIHTITFCHSWAKDVSSIAKVLDLDNLASGMSDSKLFCSRSFVHMNYISMKQTPRNKQNELHSTYTWCQNPYEGTVAVFRFAISSDFNLNHSKKNILNKNESREELFYVGTAAGVIAFRSYYNQRNTKHSFICHFE